MDANLTVNENSYVSSIHGMINGAGATSLSGVFYSNDLTPDYVGAFTVVKQ